MIPVEKLRWQCRRGTKELDLLLRGYLETEYLQAGDEEKALFIEMLTMGDNDLIAFFIDGKKPVEAGLDSLIDKIRGISASRK